MEGPEDEVLPRRRDSGGDNLDGLDDPEVARGGVDGDGVQVEDVLGLLVPPPLLPLPPDVEGARGGGDDAPIVGVVAFVDFLKSLRLGAACGDLGVEEGHKGEGHEDEGHDEEGQEGEHRHPPVGQGTSMSWGSQCSRSG